MPGVKVRRVTCCNGVSTGHNARSVPRCQQRIFLSSTNGQPSTSYTHENRLFVFGMGYTTVGLADLAVAKGWKVSGTVRRPSAREKLQQRGFDIHAFEPATGCLLSAEGKEHLSSSSHVLSSIPPLALRLYDPVLHEQQQLLTQCGKNAYWVGYLSSTGVYGDWEGEWVDERSETRSNSGRGIVRKDHEEAWLQLHANNHLPVHIFRLAGIYGPGRSVLNSISLQSPPSTSQQRRTRQRFTSRCHVYDICSVLLASMAQPQAAATIYNVADDDPAPRHEVMEYARERLGLRGQPLPASSAQEAPNTQETQDATSAVGMARSDGRNRRSSGEPDSLEEKRVMNSKIKEELGVKLQFPTYREGIDAIIAGDIRPFKTLEEL